VLVVEKLTKVFGERRGRELLGQVLAELRLPCVTSTEDLARFAEALQTRGGFEATTGAMLGVLATMRRMNEPR
jgi:hypothetical protein